MKVIRRKRSFQERFRSVSLDRIVPAPRRLRTRRDFDENELEELSLSIKQKGILQPVILRQRRKGLELIAGSRRVKASEIAGEPKIPACILDIGDLAALEIAIMENIQREDLTPIEEAEVFQSWIELYKRKNPREKKRAKGYFCSLLAKKLGKSIGFIYDRLRLLELPEEVKEMVDDGHLPSSSAFHLLPIKSPEKQKQIAKEIVGEPLTTKQVKDFIDRSRVERTDRREPEDIFIARRVKEMKDALSCLLFFGKEIQDAKAWIEKVYKINPGYLTKLRGLLLKVTGNLDFILQCIEDKMQKERQRLAEIKRLRR